MGRARMRLFEQALRDRGLKSTSQRDDIAKAFFGAGEHLSVEELHAAVKKVNPRVGYATVHRTVRLLKDLGFAAERHFDDAQARYERVDEEHHDHLICERCGRIVEFQNEEIESLQESVARALDFVISWHRMELYGICRDCREGRQRGGRGVDRTVHRVQALPRREGPS
jgi:Fur family ferric uptake transcriptional regulator